LASIDAFWDLAAQESAPKPVLRMSLVRLGSPATTKTDQSEARQRRLILLGVALLEVLFILMLREAMRPLSSVRSADSVPMQITFIERRLAQVVPKPTVAPPPTHPQVLPQRKSQPQSLPRPQPVTARTNAPHSEALQAVTIAPAVKPVVAIPPGTFLFDPGGAVHVPVAPTPDHPRDLLAHRDVSFMLPGGARKNSPDFHVRDDLAPKDVVNAGLAIAATLLANGNAPRPDMDGLVQTRPDRGVRTSDGTSDPCQDLAQDRIDPSDEKARDEAEERYEKACEGH